MKYFTISRDVSLVNLYEDEIALCSADAKHPLLTWLHVLANSGRQEARVL